MIQSTLLALVVCGSLQEEPVQRPPWQEAGKRRAAEPAEDQWGGAYRLWFGSLSGTVSKDQAAVEGTDVRVTGDLDVGQNETFHDLSFWVRLREIGYVRAQWWFGSFEGSETLDSTITFGGASYAAGSSVDSEVSAHVAGLTFEYTLWDSADLGTRGEIGGLVGLRYVSISAEIESATVAEEGDVSALIPVLGLRAALVPSDVVRGEIELSGIIFGGGGRAVRALDLRIEVAATPWKGVVAGIGYHLVDAFTKSDEGDEESETNLRLQGPYLTIGARF